MAHLNEEYLKDHKTFRVRNQKRLVIFPLIAILVAITVFWSLKLIGITVTSDTLCELDEHTHTEVCYNEDGLICTKPEHKHSSECFPEKKMDVETSYDWKQTFDNVIITNDVTENLVSIASTQVGYNESAKNYEYDAFAVKRGYTRYGEWYGSPYGEWNTMFVSFCMNYANIQNSDSFISASAEIMHKTWQKENLYLPLGNYSGSRGDVVFFDTNSDLKADRTGIVAFQSENLLIVIEGNVSGAVEKVVYKDTKTIMGFGKTGSLSEAEHIDNPQSEQSVGTTIKTTELTGRLNRYIPNDGGGPVKFKALRTRALPSVYGSEPLQTMAEEGPDITYTSHLENEVVGVSFKTLSGVELGSGSTVYIGEVYMVSLEFSEINTGSDWVQFRHNADGFLTYHLPSNIHCAPFNEWHKITAKTESGTVEDVGEYFIDETGLLRVRFFEDANGVNFVEKYSNVDFNIDFSASVASSSQTGGSVIEFNDKINIDLQIDGSSGMDVTKTHGEYNNDTHTMEYTIRVEATYGVVKDLVLDDEIWENHYALRDTIVVTDLNGNPITPQPTISDHPYAYQGADEGFRLTGFPDFSAGNGFLIKYQSQIYDAMLSGETVDMWNGVNVSGKSPNGGTPTDYGDDWLRIELEKIQKQGKQAVVTDNSGNAVPVIEWEVEIRKDNHNLKGTVLIDTLGDGLAYYTGKDIRVKCYDEWGNRLPDVYISWNDVTINGNTMSFSLPDGYAFDIVYYTTYEDPVQGETKKYENTVKAVINGKEEQAGGSADVVAFVPRVTKSASGNDGKFVTFTIEADVPGVIKDKGGFYLTDLSAFWSYPNDAGHLYIENMPQDMVITAQTESGQTITFTPYKEGLPVENTYILYAPAEGNQMHSFNVFFNTSTIDKPSSKWILAEDAKLTISYRIPFDSKTGIEWPGELSGEDTLGDVLLQGYKMANEAYLNYTMDVSGVASATYDYTPKITKKSSVHEDGTIDYTVVFNNTVPGSNGDQGYITAAVDKLWFNDTFDERLEYVPGSLIVTGYSPWQTDLWIAKYQYNGTADGNVIKALAEDFKFYQYNSDADASGWNGITQTKTFKNYCDWINHGGKFVFTYKLKVKDEYLYTTEFAKFELDNTAELTWDEDGTSGPVTETSEFYTGLLHKHVVQDDSKLTFSLHINRKALDILEGTDKLIIEDTMSENLSVYWDSIKLVYEKSPDEWVDFSSPYSEYTYTVTYDPITNSMTFTVPDSLHIIIEYTTLITQSGLISVENAVKIEGKAEIADIVDAFFNVEEHTGGASGSNQKIVLMKQDGLSNIALPNATFFLYGPKGDATAQIPAGVSQTIVTERGETLRFIGTYTTGPDGTATIESQYLTFGGPYALVEYIPPQEYELLENPIYFYFYDQDPQGKIQTVTTMVVVENYMGKVVFPATGGRGTVTYTAGGLVCLGIATGVLMYKWKKRRKEDSAPL